jgi:gamma-glutamyltranspeptidase / glutathione hydrolase
MKALRMTTLVVLLSIACAVAAGEGEPRPGQAAIASAHPLATAAGQEILSAGGNAFDAAVAVSAALAVVEPYSSGLGGGGFYLLHRRANDSAVFIDAREAAPAAATPDMFLDEQGEPVTARMREGPLSAGIPGHPAALAHIAVHHGRLPLAVSLAPAIRLALDGFPADERLVTITTRSEPLLRRHGTTAFFIEDRVPAVGERLRQRELGRTLEELARDGGESFYRGETARRLVAGVRAAGGIWTEQDLADYRVVVRRPLVGEYRGNRILTAPPPSSGGTALLTTLNILAGTDFHAWAAVDRAHWLVESWRRAYRDRGRYIGDPAFVDIPLTRLLGAGHAAVLRASIDPERATPSAALPGVAAHDGGTSTTHFSVMDADGNSVAATQTINFRYGAGLMPDGTGVVLNNEMFDFAPLPGRPDGFELVSSDVNLPGPMKRPVSSMTPTIVEGPRGVAILGTPGGSRIISMVTLALIGWVDGLDADALVALPRFHHQYLPDTVSHEADAALAGLAERGHELRPTGRRYGNMNVVTWDFEEDTVRAATDPRNAAPADF